MRIRYLIDKRVINVNILEKVSKNYPLCRIVVDSYSGLIIDAYVHYGPRRQRYINMTGLKREEDRNGK